MAALRQLLSAKELTGALYPRALPEESRQMVKQKMEAMGYPVSPPAVPTKETPPATNNETQNLRPVKYNKEEPVAKVSNSYEDYDRSIYTSMYEERLSRDMTPALSSSLPYRPNALNVSETQLNKAVYGQRRRSRSVSQDTQNNNNPWDTYNANQGRGLRRKDSARSLSQPPDDQQNNPSSIQTLQDRPNAPQANHVRENLNILHGEQADRSRPRLNLCPRSGRRSAASIRDQSHHTILWAVITAAMRTRWAVASSTVCHLWKQVVEKGRGTRQTWTTRRTSWQPRRIPNWRPSPSTTTRHHSSLKTL